MRKWQYVVKDVSITETSSKWENMNFIKWFCYNRLFSADGKSSFCSKIWEHLCLNGNGVGYQILRWHAERVAFRLSEDKPQWYKNVAFSLLFRKFKIASNVMAFAQNYPMLHCLPQFEARAILAPTRPAAQCLGKRSKSLLFYRTAVVTSAKLVQKWAPKMTKPQQFLSEKH